jgi:hypothetical protein
VLCKELKICTLLVSAFTVYTVRLEGIQSFLYISICKFKLGVVIQNYIIGNFSSLYVILGFCREVYELHALLGHYTVYGDNYLQMFRDR